MCAANFTRWLSVPERGCSALSTQGFRGSRKRSYTTRGSLKLKRGRKSRFLDWGSEKVTRGEEEKQVAGHQGNRQLSAFLLALLMDEPIIKSIFLKPAMPLLRQIIQQGKFKDCIIVIFVKNVLVFSLQKLNSTRSFLQFGVLGYRRKKSPFGRTRKKHPLQ